MNAIVEVETASMTAKASTVVVAALVNTFVKMFVALSQTVSTSTVLSMGGTSISAVSPDNYFRKEPALAGA